MLDWIGITDEDERFTRTGLMNALGKPKLIRQVVAIPLAAYTKALEFQVREKQGENTVLTDLNPLEIGQVGEVRRIARIVLGLSPEVTTSGPIATALSMAAASPSGSGTPAAAPSTTASDVAQLANAIKEAVRPASKRICASRVLDQADDTEVMPLDPKVLSTMVEDWRVLENDGEEPTEEEEATSEQLASLEGRAKTGATPFVDFGVWRPFGYRMERALKFVVHQRQTDGSSSPKEINGPDSYTQWVKCWRVYSFAMVTLKLASRTRLQRYADRIRTLSEEWPQFWWVIGLADIKMRSETLERVRRECIRRKARGMLPDFDATKPWDVAYREAAADTDFWAKEVDKQIVMYCTSLRSAATIMDTGTGPIVEMKSGGSRKRAAPLDSESDASSVPKKRSNATRAKKKNKAKGKAHGPKKEPQRAQGAKAGGKGQALIVDLARADEKKADGAWTRDAAGCQICWAYNKGKCGGNCPTGRAHACERCRSTAHGAHKH